MADNSFTTAATLRGTRIALPEVDVSLQDLATSATVSTAKTQLDGVFHLKAPATGSYRVCWNAGGIGSGCGEKFAVNDSDVAFEVVPVRAKPGVIYGKVLTGDSRPCWLHDPFFKLNVQTRVSLLDAVGNAVQPDVPANTRGEYAFGSVVAPSSYLIRARCENAKGEEPVTLRGSATTADITLPNRAPQIVGMSAFDGTQGIVRAPSGAIVQVDAEIRDPDGDPIEYLWRTLDGSGTIPGTNDRRQDWTLASTPGVQSVYLMARDGKGGYAYNRLDLQVGATQVGFSGIVIDETTQNAVPGATVTVNGSGTTTNAQGWFRLAVPPTPFPERYVLNISHPQYALLSRIHDNSAEGNTYELIRAQTTAEHPGRIIDVVDTSSSGPCGGRQEKSTPSSPLRPWAAGKGQDQPPQCVPRGARIILQPGVLVDASNNPAPDPVNVSIATLNPARRALPGDYRAVDLGNRPVEMVSFGAVFVEIHDALGNPLNLGHGSSAEIRVPVSVQQLPSAKPSIAIWSYDLGRGLWVEEGLATLQNVPAEGWMYVGATKHFSTLNMDVAGNDPAQATCVRFQLGASLAGWTNLVLRAYVSYAGTSVKVKETALDGAQYHAIYRIPYAPPAPPPNTLRLELRGTYGGVQKVLLNNVIATDAPRPKMTGNNLWPPPNYVECGDVVTLEADPINLPYYGDINATGRPAFLTGPNGQFLPVDGDAVATAYYNNIDPPGPNDNSTLSKWWSNHGFNGADGSGGTRAAYLNDNDLGFGRDMNCKTTGGDLACYVTNYGAPDQNPDNADAALNRTAAKRLATVAMEYKSSEPQVRRVRFYVYAGGNPATAGKLKFADLDGLGPKPVPYLCIVCHGGTYDAPNNNTQHAPAFATLNQMVRDVAPNGSPIQVLINNWYPGGFGPGTAPVQPADASLPDAWTAHASAYHNVFAKSCRTCHVARDADQPNAFFTFNTFADFAGGFPHGRVCGSPKVMPNAFVTYKNFWNDTQRVIDFSNLAGGGPCQ